jgi:hypothetical protein
MKEPEYTVRQRNVTNQKKQRTDTKSSREKEKAVIENCGAIGNL